MPFGLLWIYAGITNLLCFIQNVLNFTEFSYNRGNNISNFRDFQYGFYSWVKQNLIQNFIHVLHDEFCNELRL